MPFRKYATAFTPEQLDAMKTAFNAAVEELNKAGLPLSDQAKTEIAERVLEHATKRGFDPAGLKQSALGLPSDVVEAGVLSTPTGSILDPLSK